jgi:hypothetical protein
LIDRASAAAAAHAGDGLLITFHPSSRCFFDPGQKWKPPRLSGHADEACGKGAARTRAPRQYVQSGSSRVILYSIAWLSMKVAPTSMVTSNRFVLMKCNFPGAAGFDRSVRLLRPCLRTDAVMEAFMRTVALALALVASLSVEPGHAQNYPWCGDRGDGSSSCGYVSYEQCMQKYRNCSRNPMYQPPAPKPRARS